MDLYQKLLGLFIDRLMDHLPLLLIFFSVLLHLIIFSKPLLLITFLRPPLQIFFKVNHRFQV